MIKIKPLEWRDVSKFYDDFETHKCNNSLGWYAIYHNNDEDAYIVEWAASEEFLFELVNVIAETKTVEEGKRAAQSYHNQRTLSLLTYEE